jgi:hypothetical protein
MPQATGTFDVKLTLQTASDSVPGRYSIDKQFHGGLVGTSRGEMLAALTAKGSGGYVALEQVTGTIEGRSGSFLLQHSGTSTRGEQQLNIIVVPDSGTAGLEGLTGRMIIHIEGGRHDYEFEYTLPTRS